MDYEKNKRKGILRGILSFSETIITILIAFVCLIILVQRISNNEKSLFGYRFFKVESGSMVPKYEISDVILVKELELNEINVGDDLVYVGIVGDYKDKIITHQVIEKKKNEKEFIFYTKGISNSTVDPAVSESQVIGVVQRKIYTLTVINKLLLNIYSLYFLIILPIVLNLFFHELHSKDKREKYFEKRIKMEKEEKARQNKKKEKKYTIKKKKEQLINNKENKKDKTLKNKNITKKK